ncbi:MAG: SRPBCC family protein [Bacteroidota bacterium]
MADYTFLTTWHFNAPIERVWELIHNTSRWPIWWKAVQEVKEISRGDDAGIGSVKRFTWRGALPYRLTFDMTATEIEHLRVIAGRAQGELDGTGRWTFREDESGTHVQYVWEVKATKFWMRWLSPLARPAFRWNHDLVMRWGEAGIRAELDAHQMAME